MTLKINLNTLIKKQMEYLDYYFERDSAFGSTDGVVNRKIKLINIFYPNLIRANDVLVTSTTTIIRQASTSSETRQLTFPEGNYTTQSFVDRINQFILDNFSTNDLRIEVVENIRCRWVNSSQNVLWRILIPDQVHASLFSPTGEVNTNIVINAGITTDSFIPDISGGISNLEIRFSDNNTLQVPWIGSYLSQTVYSFPMPILINLKNASRVEIRANFGGANRFEILTSPLRRVLRLGFQEVKQA